jgi:hypothetical protein
LTCVIALLGLGDLGTPMISLWAAILAVAQANAVIALLASSLLAALVVTETLVGEGRFAFDAKAVGLAVAALTLLLQAPVLVVVALAAVATVVTRAYFG